MNLATIVPCYMQQEISTTTKVVDNLATELAMLADIDRFNPVAGDIVEWYRVLTAVLQ